MYHLPQIFGAVKGMDMQAVADLAGHPAHIGINASDEDGGLRVGYRPRAEEWSHEVEGEELAMESERGAVLPTIPDSADREHHFAQLRSRGFEFDRKAALVVRLHL